MLKVKAFLVALLLATISMALLSLIFIPKINNYYKVNDNSVRYNISLAKYRSKDILTSNIDENTLVLMGSSELVDTENETYHPRTVFNYDDFHIMQIGAGYYQNIVHAATLGSIGNDIKNKKVAIVESMQWFVKDGIGKQAFMTRISEEHVYNTLKNEKISKETKEKLINRVIELSSDNKGQNDNYKLYKKIFIDGTATTKEKLEVEASIKFANFKQKLRFYENRSIDNLELAGSTTPNYDWDKMKEEVVKDAESRTNNNDYGIENTFYNKKIKGKYEELKNSLADVNYDTSPEYEDFDIFLSIAKDLGIEVQVIVFPANGPWYDYTGMSVETRKRFYDRMTKLSQEKNFNLVNYGDREYDKYFLYDIMHVGWKGWIEVERELYNFAKKDK